MRILDVRLFDFRKKFGGFGRTTSLLQMKAESAQATGLRPNKKTRIMKTLWSVQLFLVAGIYLIAPLSTSAAIRYVNVNSLNPTPPYTNWATAATVIQDAVDTALPGDEVVVTNGIYLTGGRRVSGVYGLYTTNGTIFETMTNRVEVTKPLTVRSANGPQVTIIQGYQVPGLTNGDGAARCVYLTNGAALIGFTLRNGATYRDSYWFAASGGGVCCESSNAVISNCILQGNSAYLGGGGVYGGTVNNCAFRANVARWGGAAQSTLNNCILIDNSAEAGGGTFASSLNNCTLAGNSASSSGGGASSGWLKNCTITGNSAGLSGGGVAYCALTNCIVYYNEALAGANCSSENFLSYCCTTPLPSSGVGNISAEPQLVSVSHIAAGSPCRGAGEPASASGVDFDGEPWANPPSIGCDEFYRGNDIGPLIVTIGAAFTNVATGFEATFLAQITGHASANHWEFGDGTILSNRLVATHAWPTPGDYTVVLRAYNETFPNGISATVTVHVVTAVHYVRADNSNPVAPYASWATAATNIQDAVDAATTGGVVLVSNGVYQTGGRAVSGTLTNRVAVTKPLTVRSVNGPEVTVIGGYRVPGTTNGDGAVRCAYLAKGAALFGFTLTNGATSDRADVGNGGGVWCDSSTTMVSNCVFSGNSAFESGGGTRGGTLFNCTLLGNSAARGGGAFMATLNDCTLINNSAKEGGGAYESTLNNCMLTGNSAEFGGGAYNGILNHCTVSGNSAASGGGAYSFAPLTGGVAVFWPRSVVLNHCIVRQNSATVGGGVRGGTLNNCEITGNLASGSGGGAWRSGLHNCILTGNSAANGGGAHQSTLFNCTLSDNSAGYGGGAYDGTLNNCLLTGNLANSGGGVYGGSLNNCTVTGNSATTSGGGVVGFPYFCANPEDGCCTEAGCTFPAGSLNNCIVYANSAPVAANFNWDAVVSYSCTTPLPATGVGNITNAPLFVDAASGNFRLQSNSPCINAGRKYYAPAGPDLDGNPRIVGGTVDIGAYEFQLPQSTISYAWLQQYGLPTDGSADLIDSDGDGHNNWQEWKAWTNPTNGLSVLKLLVPQPGANGVRVVWQSASGQSYFLERSTNAGGSFTLLRSNILGQAGTTSVTDTNTIGPGASLYRVAVP